MRVRGVEGLRVVDASAMPDLVRAHINACVIMMAEKASDMIRRRMRATGGHECVIGVCDHEYLIDEFVNMDASTGSSVLFH